MESILLWSVIRNNEVHVGFRVRILIPLAALIPATFAFIMFVASPDTRSDFHHFLFAVPLVLCLVGLMIIPHTTTRIKYYAVQGFIVFFYLMTVFATADLLRVQLLVHLIFVTELILFEPFPHNLAESIGLTAFVIALDLLVAGTRGSGALLDIFIFIFVPGASIALFGSFMTKHRELVVYLARDRDRLTNSVVELTRANSAYQDYALVVQESATERERRRITRDIHDIVGYTLTNNMMLMEAAHDLSKENPLALSSIIETARENAQEGLAQVRAAMYKLREQTNAYPVGLNAISRLSRIFEKATGIVVHNNFGNMPLLITDEIDSCIYHLVQEALVNAFRHGRATEIHISFWLSERDIHVNVRDNGTSADQVSEGIGIMGMKERIEKVAGVVNAKGVKDGFLVSAIIPRPGVE